mmetsp:Transcript_16220/g.25934  ORF Transcript_16220/g.25934 Transcript_16220/m.25934 type:complete len:252 (-) Transcript_16220:301-1056(-)
MRLCSSPSSCSGNALSLRGREPACSGYRSGFFFPQTSSSPSHATPSWYPSSCPSMPSTYSTSMPSVGCESRTGEEMTGSVGGFSSSSSDTAPPPLPFGVYFHVLFTYVLASCSVVSMLTIVAFSFLVASAFARVRCSSSLRRSLSSASFLALSASMSTTARPASVLRSESPAAASLRFLNSSLLIISWRLSAFATSRSDFLARSARSEFFIVTRSSAPSSADSTTSRSSLLLAILYFNVLAFSVYSNVRLL